MPLPHATTCCAAATPVTSVRRDCTLLHYLHVSPTSVPAIFCSFCLLYLHLLCCKTTRNEQDAVAAARAEGVRHTASLHSGAQSPQTQRRPGMRYAARNGSYAFSRTRGELWLRDKTTAHLLRDIARQRHNLTGGATDCAAAAATQAPQRLPRGLSLASSPAENMNLRNVKRPLRALATRYHAISAPAPAIPYMRRPARREEDERAQRTALHACHAPRKAIEKQKTAGGQRKSIIGMASAAQRAAEGGATWPRIGEIPHRRLRGTNNAAAAGAFKNSANGRQGT